MEFSTTLPPGFTTWNELWSKMPNRHYGGLEIFHHVHDGSDNSYSMVYQVDFIKARAYDEIMDKLKQLEGYVIQDPHRMYENTSYIVLDAISKLTHTDLFK